MSYFYHPNLIFRQKSFRTKPLNYFAPWCADLMLKSETEWWIKTE